MIAQLSAVAPQDLHEDNIEAADAIEAAVRAHVKGMDPDDARDVLQQDGTALQEWLQRPELASSSGYFIFGHLMGLSMWADFDELTGEAP